MASSDGGSGLGSGVFGSETDFAGLPVKSGVELTPKEILESKMSVREKIGYEDLLAVRLRSWVPA